MKIKGEMITMNSLSEDQEVKTKEAFIRDLNTDGYLVLTKTDVLNKLGLGD
jgi:hypothetical protein